MKKRIITGIIFFAVLVPLLVVDALLPAFQVVCGFLTIVGAWEMLRLYGREKKYPIAVQVIVILSTILVFLSGLTIWEPFKAEIALDPDAPNIMQYLVFDTKISFALLILAVVMQLSLLVFNKDFDAKDIGKTIATAFYVGLGMAALLTLRMIGIRFIVYLFMITWITDVFAFFFGMLFGKNKMIERISPKKTWEGAIGGTIVATITASLFAFLYGQLFAGDVLNPKGLNTIFDIFIVDSTKANPILTFVLIFIVTLLTSIAGQLGDLIASRLKRTYDVKDYSNIFPGHGGVLDRFDSSIFASMVLLILFLIVAGIQII
jgi:phosphatidate cytidylyltransferase